MPDRFDPDGCEDYAACVSGSFENASESAWVSINVGTYRKGILGAPTVDDVGIYNKRPGKHGIRKFQLQGLPAALSLVRE